MFLEVDYGRRIEANLVDQTFDEIVVSRGRLLRMASLLVMLLAAGKVFLFDVGRLGDLYRVLSFLGLGVSLLLIAYLYQRFVFRE